MIAYYYHAVLANPGQAPEWKQTTTEIKTEFELKV